MSRRREWERGVAAALSKTGLQSIKLDKKHGVSQTTDDGF